MSEFPRVLWDDDEMERLCEECRKNGARVHDPFPGCVHVSWEKTTGDGWNAVGVTTYYGLAIYNKGRRDGVWTCTGPSGSIPFSWDNGTTRPKS